jgi:hypothetical protein
VRKCERCAEAFPEALLLKLMKTKDLRPFVFCGRAALPALKCAAGVYLVEQTKHFFGWGLAEKVAKAIANRSE